MLLSKSNWLTQRVPDFFGYFKLVGARTVREDIGHHCGSCGWLLGLVLLVKRLFLWEGRVHLALGLRLPVFPLFVLRWISHIKCGKWALNGVFSACHPDTVLPKGLHTVLYPANTLSHVLVSCQSIPLVSVQAHRVHVTLSSTFGP